MIVISRLWYPRSPDGCLRKLLYPRILNEMHPRYDWCHWKSGIFPEHNMSSNKSHLSLIFQDLLVNPLPKERWNSTAASCSSNTIGPLCSDVIEKNWDFFLRCFSLDLIRKKIKNLSIDKTNTLERFTLSLSGIWSLFHGHFYRFFLET